jgi:hypothetical protein
VGPQEGPVLVPLLGPLDLLRTRCWASVGSPAGFLLDFLPTRCWALKRGQCWFPCWVTIGLPADQVLGPQEGPVLVPLLVIIGPPADRWYWALCGASVGSPAGYGLTSC